MERFTIFFILSQGCKQGIPREIIQPNKMEKVLFDIHVVDGYISTISNQDTTKIIASSYYNGIYKKFEIDSALFNKSMDYYYSHPVILNDIYGNVEKAFTIANEKLEKKIAADEKLNNINNSSLVILANLPPTIVGSRIDVNPFNLTLSLSRL